MGYPENDNTWEKKKNVFCEDLIDQFEARFKKKEHEEGSTDTIQSESESETSNAAKRPKTVTDRESNSKETLLNDKSNCQGKSKRHDKVGSYFLFAFVHRI